MVDFETYYEEKVETLFEHLRKYEISDVVFDDIEDKIIREEFTTTIEIDNYILPFIRKESAKKRLNRYLKKEIRK